MAKPHWLAVPLVVSITTAMGAKNGILLSPAFGAVLMSVSTIVVAINAQLLRRTGL